MKNKIENETDKEKRMAKEKEEINRRFKYYDKSKFICYDTINALTQFIYANKKHVKNLVID